jgi:hypothetical protein
LRAAPHRTVQAATPLPRSFQNRNIYLILCRLLGIESAPNDGDWREIKRMFRER